MGKIVQPYSSDNAVSLKWNNKTYHSAMKRILFSTLSAAMILASSCCGSGQRFYPASKQQVYIGEDIAVLAILRYNAHLVTELAVSTSHKDTMHCIMILSYVQQLTILD